MLGSFFGRQPGACTGAFLALLLLAAPALACSFDDVDVRLVLGEVGRSQLSGRTLPANLALRVPEELAGAPGVFSAAGLSLVALEDADGLAPGPDLERLAEVAIGAADLAPPSPPTLLSATVEELDPYDDRSSCFGTPYTRIDIDPAVDETADALRISYAVFTGPTAVSARAATEPTRLMTLGTVADDRLDGPFRLPAGNWVRLVALDQAGNASESSDVVQIVDVTPAPGGCAAGAGASGAVLFALYLGRLRRRWLG